MRNKIALVKLSAIGDIVHASVCVQIIRAHMPEAYIAWIVDSRFADLVRACAGVDEVVPIGLKDKEYQKSLKTLLSMPKFDYVIDLQGLIKSAIVSRLLGRVSGFSYKSAKEGVASLLYSRRLKMDYNENIIIRNVSLVSFALGFRVSVNDILTKKPCFSIDTHKLPKKGNKKLVLIALFASEPSKCYDKFKEVILGLIPMGVDVVIPHSNDTELNSAKLIASASGARVLERKSLLDMISFISGCDLVIGNDSGLTHLAWAQNVPSITLFGNRPSHRNAFVTDKNITIDSGKKIDAKKIDKSDFSVCEIAPNEIIKNARRFL